MAAINTGEPGGLDGYLQMLVNVIKCQQHIESSIGRSRQSLRSVGFIQAAVRGKELSAMEGITTSSLTSTATALEKRGHTEHLGRRVGASLMIMLGGFGLAGCAAAEAHQPTPTASATATEAAPANDLTTQEKIDWGADCPLSDELYQELHNLPQVNVDYLRQAFAEVQELGTNNYTDLCNDLVDDLGTQLVKDHKN